LAISLKLTEAPEELTAVLLVRVRLFFIPRMISNKCLKKTRNIFFSSFFVCFRVLCTRRPGGTRAGYFFAIISRAQDNTNTANDAMTSASLPLTPPW
jgi:hypothetical protein